MITDSNTSSACPDTNEAARRIAEEMGRVLGKFLARKLIEVNNQKSVTIETSSGAVSRESKVIIPLAEQV